jgi:hypothetical protein
MRSASDEVAGTQRATFFHEAFISLSGTARSLCTSCYCFATNAATGDTVHKQDPGYDSLAAADRVGLAGIEYVLSRAFTSLPPAGCARVIELLSQCGLDGS